MQKKDVRAEKKQVHWIKYGLFFSALWCLLTRGDLASWTFGIFLVPLATWSAINLFQEKEREKHQHQLQLHLFPFLRFIPYFLTQSLKGGWECATYAIFPQRKVNPGFLQYTTYLPAGRPQLFFVNTISLLPGTVCVGWENEKLTIHAIDKNADHIKSLEDCERHIAILFGLVHPTERELDTNAGDNN